MSKAAALAAAAAEKTAAENAFTAAVATALAAFETAYAAYLADLAAANALPDDSVVQTHVMVTNLSRFRCEVHLLNSDLSPMGDQAFLLNIGFILSVPINTGFSAQTVADATGFPSVSLNFPVGAQDFNFYSAMDITGPALTLFAGSSQPASSATGSFVVAGVGVNGDTVTITVDANTFIFRLNLNSDPTDPGMLDYTSDDAAALEAAINSAFTAFYPPASLAGSTATLLSTLTGPTSIVGITPSNPSNITVVVASPGT